MNDKYILEKLRDITKNRDFWMVNIDDDCCDEVKAKALWLLGEMGLKYPVEIEGYVDDIAAYIENDNPLLMQRSVNALGRIGRADNDLIIDYFEKLMKTGYDESEKRKGMLLSGPVKI